MDLGLKGKTAIVTGGASNIGRQICLTYADEGASVAIADLDEAGARETAKECVKRGAKAMAIKTDVGDLESVGAMVETVVQEFGGVYALVNNAAWWVDKPFIESTVDEWRKTVDVALYGTLNCSKAVLPHMVRARLGRIVSISSDAGRIGENRQTPYSAAKGGIIAFSKALATEVGRYNITSNVVCPGITWPTTPESRRGVWGERPGSGVASEDRLQAMLRLYPMRRLGKASDTADAVVFLSSERSSWITGQTLSVSGGFSRV